MKNQRLTQLLILICARAVVLYDPRFGFGVTPVEKIVLTQLISPHDPGFCFAPLFFALHIFMPARLRFPVKSTKREGAELSG
jgi:hypothetical protein